MNDNYLWDKSGRDREVEALEDLLSPLAHRERPAPAQRAPVKWGSVVAALASAAVVALAIRWGLPGEHPGRPPSAPLAEARDFDLGKYGLVHAHAGSIVRVVRSSEDEIRLRLDRGTIEARITLEARPGLFQVETPATTCVDLGCHYTLAVAPDGSAYVHVDTGQVAFVDGTRETWIPSGASCRAFPGRGSATPRWDDAPAELREAVERLDRAAPGDRRVEAFGAVARCSRAPDSLTLWHLAHDPDPSITEFAWDALIRLLDPQGSVPHPRAPEAADAWKSRIRAAH